MSSSNADGATSSVAPYRRLRAWHLGHELALAVYTVTSDWPTHEKYGLTSQARRAACSVPLNIAEGSARRGPREFGRFLSIAFGSLTELSYILLLARDLKYLSEADWSRLEALRDEASRTTWGLHCSIRPPAPSKKSGRPSRTT